MFNYDFPFDPGQTIATVDATGHSTGTAGNVIGVSAGSRFSRYREGPAPGIVLVTVSPPDPPGPVYVLNGQTDCSELERQYLGLESAYVNYRAALPPAPPPPPFGVCQSSPAPIPCWHWDSTANNGGGAWVFVPPGGDFPPAWISPIYNPVQSQDPNAISGPSGVGAQLGTSLSNKPHRILDLFQNEPTAACAPTRSLLLTRLIFTRFDPTTVALGPITFPGFPGVLPPSVPLQGLGQFSTQVSLTTTNLLVNVSASLNSTTGLLTWTLQAIDPATGQPPTDPSLGVLPPGGNGAVSFTARVLPSLTTVTAIDDQAVVTFDANAPISTSVWSNMLDVTPPTSSVQPLPPAEPNIVFTLSLVGNVESAKTAAEATTLVTLPLPTTTFTGAPATAAYNTTFTVTATTNASTTAVITASGACSIVGNTVTMTSGTGTCTLTANWAADANYPAATATQTVTATGATATVTFTGAPASAVYGSSFTVASTTNASTTAVITASGACSILGNTVTMTSGTGVCSLTANWTADNDYASTSATQTVTATMATATVTFTGAPASAVYGSTFTIASTTNGSTTAVITASGACSVSGNMVTMTSGTGTCSLTANWAADTNYGSATASQATMAMLATPTVTFTGAPASAAIRFDLSPSRPRPTPAARARSRPAARARFSATPSR